MCGIAGISMRQNQPLAGDVLARLSHHLAHRGPDGDGIYLTENMGLAHRRLSIIDVSGGQQPISDRAEKMHIIVNGEIYNYLPLREELEKDGVQFKTHSDSEIPLYLYQKHGLDFVRYLDGMYALAILDETKGEIILARDPVGIKPLYTCTNDDGIVFASEAGAIAKSSWIEPRMNMEALPALLNRQFIHGADTLFAGIKRVLPGEVLRISHGQVMERKLYPLELRAAEGVNEPDALEQFDRLFNQKIATHLQAEVPYGTFLSGGIDSSAVVSGMTDHTKNIRTYTIGFDSVSVADERSQAEQFAKKIGTSQCSVDFEEDDFWHYLPKMCEAMDDLVADYAALPTLKLAERAHEDVKIILSGEGGDEIFAGYGRYRNRSLWRRILGRPYRGRGDAIRFLHLFRNPSQIQQQLRLELPDKHYQHRGFTQLQTYQARDIAEWLPHDLLIKVDRCLMRHSIEGRVPLLDREMVAFAFALPDDLKIRNKKGKWLLKKWLDKRHPELNVWAPKRGFTVPIHEWLEKRREKLLPYLATHPGLCEVLNPDAVTKWLEKPLTAKSAKLLFTLLCVALWYDVHIEGEHPSLQDHAPSESTPA